MANTPTRDFDRLVQNIYALAVDDWTVFRQNALERLCMHFGAVGAAWLTVPGSGSGGEFSEWPFEAGHTRQQLESIKFPHGKRDLDLAPLAENLRGTVTVEGEVGFAVKYAHRGADLISILLMRFPKASPLSDADALRRAVGYVVEANTLALRYFIQRDEWLQSMGRSSRGTAALVDQSSTIYAASKAFRDMVGAECGDKDFQRLPGGLPQAVIDEEGTFSWGSLHFRVSHQKNLFLLHVRAPLPLDGLSPREQEIARALGAGKTFKSVARQYDIAVSTVANHASRIYRKLGVYRREDLVQLVRKPGNDRKTH